MPEEAVLFGMRPGRNWWHRWDCHTSNGCRHRLRCLRWGAGNRKVPIHWGRWCEKSHAWTAAFDGCRKETILIELSIIQSALSPDSSYSFHLLCRIKEKYTDTPVVALYIQNGEGPVIRQCDFVFDILQVGGSVGIARKINQEQVMGDGDKWKSIQIHEVGDKWGWRRVEDDLVAVGCEGGSLLCHLLLMLEGGLVFWTRATISAHRLSLRTKSKSGSDIRWSASLKAGSLAKRSRLLKAFFASLASE